MLSGCHQVGSPPSGAAPIIIHFLLLAADSSSAECTDGSGDLDVPLAPGQ